MADNDKIKEIDDNPTEAAQALEVLGQFLASNKVQAGTLGSAYRSLAEIITAHPELADKAFELFKTALELPYNYHDELESAYKSLLEIIKAHPELDDQVVEVFGKTLEAKNGNSLEDALWNLSEIIKSNPKYVKQVLESVDKILASDNVNVYTLHSTYKVLEEIIETYPELADQVFESFKTALASDRNEDFSLSQASWSFSEIIKSNPEYAEQVLELLGKVLESKKNDEYSLATFYDFTSEIIKARPELDGQACELLNKALESKEFDRRHLRSAYLSLSDIIIAHPKLADQAFKYFKIYLASDENDWNSLEDASQSLFHIMQSNPEYAEQVLEMLDRCLASDKTGWHALSSDYKCIHEIIKARPELADQAFESFKTALASDKNDQGSLYTAYKSLSYIIQSNPQYSTQALELFKNALESQKNDWRSLESAYEGLSEIVKAHPECADQTFDVFKTALASDKNNEDSLYATYNSLSEIIKAHPKHVDQAFALFKMLLQSDANYAGALKFAYKSLAEIITAHPELADKAFESFKTALTSDRNSRTSLEDASQKLCEIVKARPELVGQVLESVDKMLASGNPDWLDQSDVKVVLEEIMDSDIIRSNPECSEQVCEICNKISTLDSHYYDYSGTICKSLLNIIQSNPKYAGQALESLDKFLASGKGSWGEPVYELLFTIIKTRPELADQAFEPLKTALVTDGNYAGTLESAYRSLAEIITAYPDLADQAFESFKTALASDRNGKDSIEMACGKLFELMPNLEDANHIKQAQGLFQKILDTGCLQQSVYGKLAKSVVAKPSVKNQILAQIFNSDDRYDLRNTTDRHELKIQRFLRHQLIDAINDEMSGKGVEADEKHSSNLKGVSLEDLSQPTKKISTYLREYDVDLGGLLDVVSYAPNTPAVDLIAQKCCDDYDKHLVDLIVQNADDISKLRYKGMFLEQIESNGDSASREANFLDEFTDRIRSLAMDKYGQSDWYTSISKAAKDPAYMQETGEIWNEMFTEADKYATLKPNSNNNAYIRELFPDKAEQLHQFVENHASEADLAKAFYKILDYHKNLTKADGMLRKYVKEHKKEYVSLNRQLVFDLVDAGIDNDKDAKRCLDIWWAANARPDRYGSRYNKYTIQDIAAIQKIPVEEPWMYGVMMQAVEAGGLKVSDGRTPSEKTLFDACKAWKIEPAMPQRVAEKVGKHGLYGRMLAGAVFDKMTKDGQTSPEEWRENKHLHEKFFEELSRAEKMDRKAALKQYIPNTAPNRKRLVGAILQEQGKEVDKDKFVGMYRHMRDINAFEDMLAPEGHDRTTFSAELLVKTARKLKEKEAQEVAPETSAKGAILKVQKPDLSAKSSNLNNDRADR